MRDAGADLLRRLGALQAGRKDPGFDRIRQESKRLARLAPDQGAELSDAQMLALAYPDRVAQRRPGDQPRYILSGGTGAQLAPEDDLASARLLVVADVEGSGTEGRIRLALPISEAELRTIHADKILWHDVCAWSKPERRVIARRQERLGAVVLADRRWEDVPSDRVAQALTHGIRDLGLPWRPAARRLQARIALLREVDPSVPDCSDAALMDDLDWLTPFLSGLSTAEDLTALDLVPGLTARIGWDAAERLKRTVPSHFETPLGRRVPIDYTDGTPAIAVRLQEMFGVTAHPDVAGQKLKVTLLSPAQRPVQTTMDLPGFWASSYADVRKDMRGQYPKHPWPEDPTSADPTLRAKPRS
ncbi:MAG: ATP-dependent helicase C-terminal domain-containing protein, partial [Pseudomonadota bacterium]